MFYGQANVDGLRIGQGNGIAAARLHDQADRIAPARIEQPGLDQPAIHGRVEPLIVDRIVDMPIGVVVGPEGADFAPGSTDERRGGKEWGSTGRSGGSPAKYKKKNKKH